MYLLLGLGTLVIILALYLRHVNNGMKQVPSEALKLSPNRWTDEEIRQTYKQISEKPLDWTPHLPPRLERRYVVVGGSGLVGGFLILHLLARGTPPENIRIIDFRTSPRRDLHRGKAAKVEFIHADITSIPSITAAFSQPWPSNVSSLPLTVFHTAASIRPGERAKVFLPRVSAVNIDGTRNVLDAAKKAGADVFIATSSASIAVRPINFWIPPWRATPKGFMQIYRNPEEDETIRPHGTYFSNYAWSKARAEQLVIQANDGDNFKTGCIRPACGVYGNKYDISFGSYMVQGHFQTWVPHIIQNFVHAENISMAHLLYEQAVLNEPSTVGGKTFTITDPNPPPTLGDLYKVANLLAGSRITYIPPVVILVMAYCMEYYCDVLAHIPLLRHFLSEPTGNLALARPSTIIAASIHQFAYDQPARKSVKEGGLGYRGACTTLEGLCNLVRQFNLEGGKE